MEDSHISSYHYNCTLKSFRHLTYTHTFVQFQPHTCKFVAKPLLLWQCK